VNLICQASFKAFFIFCRKPLAPNCRLRPRKSTLTHHRVPPSRAPAHIGVSDANLRASSAPTPPPPRPSALSAASPSFATSPYFPCSPPRAPHAHRGPRLEVELGQARAPGRRAHFGILRLSGAPTGKLCGCRQVARGCR
jgi:hypothetical protein